MGRQSHAHITDQGRPSGSTLFDEVENVATVWHSEMSALGDPVDEKRQHRVAQSGQRFLSGEARTQLECRDSEAVTPGLGDVQNESGIHEHAQQLVDR